MVFKPSESGQKKRIKIEIEIGPQKILENLEVKGGRGEQYVYVVGAFHIWNKKEIK